MNRKQFKITLLFTALAFPFNIAAQEERLPGVFDKETPQVEIPKKHTIEQAPAEPLKDAPVMEQVKDPGKAVPTIKTVSFSGNTVISNEYLQSIAAPYLQRDLTNADLAKLKYDITKAYYDKGYILVKVVTPPQDLQNNALKVEIYEARIGKINIQDNDVLHPWLIESFTERVKEGDVFDEFSAESMISDIDNLKNIGALINLQPGSTFGTTDLNVILRDTDEDKNYITLDNYGSELTGRLIAAANLEKSNAFNLGETLSARLRRSDDQLWSTAFGIDIPIGIKNIKLELDFIHSENEIGDRLAALDASGKTDAVSAALSHNVINTHNQKATARVGLEARTHKSFLTDVTETKDDIRRVYLDGSYLNRQINSVWYAQATLSKGLDALGANEQGDALATRTLGDPDALRFEPVLYANIRPIPEGTIKILASGQLSSNTLLSSDLFILGGYGSVRGFEPAEETGEGGYQFNIQYSHEIPVDPDWTIKAGPFIDGGAVYNRIDGATLDSHLYSAGIGIEITTDVLPGDDTKLLFDWAHPLGSYKSTTVDDNTFYFRVTKHISLFD